MQMIADLKAEGLPLLFAGDVVGTGSSRKSATNSVLWFMGDDIPHVPNKRGGGLCLGGKIAPIFFNTMEDAGALPIEVDVSNMNMGDVIDVYPFKGEVRNHETGELLASFELKTEVLIDEVRAGGRIPLIIGRGLTTKAREALGLPHSDVFRQAKDVAESSRGFSLAQKMVGRACGVKGIRPGAYCEPKMTSVGSQDTTGPMTRDELKDLAGSRLVSKLDEIIAQENINVVQLASMKLQNEYNGYITYVVPGLAKDLEKAGAKYVYHSVTREGDVIKILQSGGISSTMSRIKQGIQNPAGASMYSDMRTGGADSAFTRVATGQAQRMKKKFSGASVYGDYQIKMSTEVLERTDYYAFEWDRFGEVADISQYGKSPMQFVKDMESGLGTPGVHPAI